MKKHLCYLLPILLGSCAPTWHETPFPTFDSVEYLQGDTVPLGEVVAPDFLITKENALFIASSRSNPMLWQYKLPELAFVSNGGHKGAQENEFSMFPMFCRTLSENLYVWGYTPFTIKEFVVDSTLIQLKKRLTLPVHENFNQMHIVRDSLLLYSAIPSEFAIKKLNLNSQKECGRIEFERDDHRESFFYTDRGIMAANDNFIVYAYCYKKQIDIYRVEDMKLHLRLTDKSVKPEIRIGDFEHTRQYYVNVIATSRYIYALLNGKDGSLSMEVLDFEGQPVAKYDFTIAPFLFDVDEVNGYMYGYNENYEDYLLRYKINL